MPESLPQLHSAQETEVPLVSVLSRKPQPRPRGQALERSALSVLESIQRRPSLNPWVTQCVQHLPSPKMTKIFKLQGSFPDYVHGSCAGASGCTGEFVVPVVGSGSRYLNGVNSGSGGVGEHDTLADATATLSPPYQQRHSTYQSLFHPRSNPAQRHWANATNKFRTNQNQLSHTTRHRKTKTW